MTDYPALLRRAAAKARETATAAPRAPWYVTHDPLGTHVENGEGRTGRVVKGAGEDRTDDKGETTADHIALWHPGVALAVAEWLDSAAHDAEQVGADPHALVVARALLNEPEET